MIKVDYHKYLNELIITESDRTYIHCLIRNKKMVLQPEEVVRQLVLKVLINDLAYPKSMIQVEKMIVVNNLRKRFDIIIYNKDLTPFMLIECKNMKVALTQETYDQVATYNIATKTEYLCITNGKETRLCSIDFRNKSYQELDSFPSYRD